MFWKKIVNWKRILSYIILVIILFLIHKSDRRNDWAESLQISLILGIFLLIIGILIIKLFFKIKKYKFSILIGGFIGAVIGFIISLIFFSKLASFIWGSPILYDLIEDIVEGTWGLLLYYLFYPIIGLPLTICMGLTNSAESPFCLGAPMAAFIVLLFLVIGAIIGWTIGKIKAKKQQPVQTQPQVQSK